MKKVTFKMSTNVKAIIAQTGCEAVHYIRWVVVNELGKSIQPNVGITFPRVGWGVIF